MIWEFKLSMMCIKIWFSKYFTCVVSIVNLQTYCIHCMMIVCAVVTHELIHVTANWCRVWIVMSAICIEISPVNAKHDAIGVMVSLKLEDHDWYIPVWKFSFFSRCGSQMAKQCKPPPPRSYVNFLISTKIQADACLSTLYAGTLKWSHPIWPLGQSRQTTTMAHGYVYQNKLTSREQIILQNYPGVLCIH